MVTTKKQFKKELQKVERWVQYIGIPFFSMITTLMLIKDINELHKNALIFWIIVSLIGNLCVWYSIRLIAIILRRYGSGLSFTLRLFLQLVVSSVVTILITWSISLFVRMNWDWFCKDCYADVKNMYLTSILFAFLINTIYESFYLFLQLSEKALETERYKKESILAQYQNLTSQLNPHFLFNGLNTLLTIVEEDTPKAVTYIQELSNVYRYVLNCHKVQWIDLASELKFTNSYILLMKMRFEENLKICFDINKSYMGYYILPLTLQLLIENSVKHNEISNCNPLYINIVCHKEKIIVSNNKQVRHLITSTTKIGLKNIQERYRYLINKEIVISDTGDSFIVEIPLISMKGDTHEPCVRNYI